MFSFQFPADLVLLSSSLPTGGCFVMTANLDGETNLKPLSAARETRSQAGPELLDKLQAQVLSPVPCCLHCTALVRLSARTPVRTCSASRAGCGWSGRAGRRR